MAVVPDLEWIVHGVPYVAPVLVGILVCLSVATGVLLPRGEPFLAALMGIAVIYPASYVMRTGFPVAVIEVLTYYLDGLMKALTWGLPVYLVAWLLRKVWPGKRADRIGT